MSEMEDSEEMEEEAQNEIDKVMFMLLLIFILELLSL